MQSIDLIKIEKRREDKEKSEQQIVKEYLFPSTNTCS